MTPGTLAARSMVQSQRFEIDGELGHGSHSVVYRARLDGVPCAIKVPRVRGTWIRWVYREAVALARVRHAALPKVIEVGEEQGMPYLAMELIEGATLASRLEQSRLEEAELLSLGRCLLSAVGAVHRAGLIHRDVKPQNIMVEPNGDIRLVDFGFAMPMELATSARGLAGTRGYSAPEQFRAPARIDGRADLYAIGAVLFEGCVGTVPKNDALSEPLAEAGCSPGFATVLCGLLEPNVEHRYPDTASVLSELNLLADGEAPRGPSGYARSPRWPTFVGRHAEVRKLRRLLDATDGSGAFVWLEGPSGSGKTHLLHAALGSGARAVVSVQSRSGDAPLATLRRCVDVFLAVRVGVGPSPLDMVREASADDLRAVAALISPVLQSALGSEDTPYGVGASFAESAAELFVRLARLCGGLVLVVDDLHWTDAASRDVLVRVAHRVREAPLVLLFASRKIEGSKDLSSRFRTIDPTRSEVLRLEALDRAAVAELISGHLDQPDVPQPLVDRVFSLAGGTPLGVHEVLRGLLDTGALRPVGGRWLLDESSAPRVALPEGAFALLERRVDELPPATCRVLELAALIGSRFTADLLARAVGISTDDVGFALAEAQRAGLVEQTGNDYRFVHDSIVELLDARLSDERRRAHHQRIAQELDVGSPSVDQLVATATHYALGIQTERRVRAFETALAAADASLARFDNESAVRFYELARVASIACGQAVQPTFHLSLGEAKLRLGEVDEALIDFQRALGSTRDQLQRATILGRIAWAHQALAESTRTSDALAKAFAEVARALPTGAGRTLVDTLATAVRMQFSRAPDEAARAALVDVLCQLHYQNFRLGAEYGEPLRALQSVVKTLELVRGFGPSREVARSHALHGVFQAATGRVDAGVRSLAHARQIAEQIGDPVTTTFCVQLSSVCACFSGQFERALELLDECVVDRGHWLELGEYCLNVANADFIESIRGRASAAWVWTERVLNRVRRSGRPTPVFTDYMVHRARAAMASVGRASETADSWLSSHLADAAARPMPKTGLFRTMSWGPRARLHLETGEWSESFERLAAEFEREGHRPRFCHPLLVEYYISVAHIRVEQALATRRSGGRPRLERLASAHGDLVKAARLPLFKAHAIVVGAWRAWLDGSSATALRLAAEAEKLAVETTCPWVLSSAARLRAHLLRDDGKLDASRDQARVAEALAQCHDAKPRAKSIIDEFGLPVVEKARSSSTTMSLASSSSRRQMEALLRLTEASLKDLRPDSQAAAILEEVLHEVDADRGTLLFLADAATATELVIGRTRDGRTLYGADGWRDQLLRHIALRGGGVKDSGIEGLLARQDARHFDEQRVISSPLYLYDRPVGAVLIERSRTSRPFAAPAVELLSLLAHHIPLSLEIARLLGERERLQSSLQHAQKMEAVGRLAGSVAHDFNNMVAAMRIALDHLSGHVDNEANHELEVFTSALRKAGKLTRQLLTFTRHSPSPPSACAIDEALSTLEPMLRTLIGRNVELRMLLGAPQEIVMLDRGGLEQALVNLAVNASDAMPSGGSLVLSTTVEVIPEGSRGSVDPGAYVAIRLADTGTGIPDDILERIFEPFFSTKPAGRGTGLGLTSVYAFAKNVRGHIDVSSAVDRGTTFRLLLPVASVATSCEELPSDRAYAATVSRTILVVDDEELLTRSVSQLLERAGYDVLIAHSGQEAIEAVLSHGADDIAVALIDVRMPGMSGPELAMRLRELEVPFKFVFMSGYSPDAASSSSQTGTILEKPFTRSELLARVRQHVPSPPTPEVSVEG